MDEIPVFEKSLEADIETLAAQIKSNREHTVEQNYNERELVKEVIRAFPNFEKPTASATVPRPPQTSASHTDGTSFMSATSPLPDYAQNAAPEVRLEIEYLLDIALRHGISKALSESEKSPYFVQDAFHDALAGRLYPELQKRGIVK
jgi:hypothetical protein